MRKEYALEVLHDRVVLINRIIKDEKPEGVSGLYWEEMLHNIKESIFILETIKNIYKN